MEVSLSGVMKETRVARGVREAEKVANSIDEVKKFLRDHEMAKIVVVVKTHSAENGRFIWRGSGTTYEGCTLFEASPYIIIYQLVLTHVQILKDCIPPVVFRFLSNAPDAPQHWHRSLIINLACGATVTLGPSRHLLLEG